MKSCIKNSFSLKSTLKILLVVKQLKEYITSDRVAQKETKKGNEIHGEYHDLLLDLLIGDREFFFRRLRMNPERFKHLFSLVKDKISKESTEFRTSISSRERVLLKIGFLATGISQQSLSFAFRIGKTTTTFILRETCEVIYDSLKDTYLRALSSTIVTHIKTIRRDLEFSSHNQGNRWKRHQNRIP